MNTTPDPPTILIRAAKSFETGSAWVPEDQELLETYLEIRTILAEGIDPDAALLSSEEHLGYLTRDVDGQAVHVPFNLAAVCPTLQDLSAMMAIGRLIHLNQSNPLCLSGSAAAMGRLPPGADLDFCEYHLTPEVGLSPAVRTLMKTDQTQLVWAKGSTKTCTEPWADLDDQFGPPIKRVKLDYVSRSNFGVLPTTTVVLGTADGETGAADQSFAYQEAVVLGSGPCRVLIKGDRIGAYIAWLMAQIPKVLEDRETHGDNAPVKALKRCLSLLLMLGSSDEIEEVVKALGDDILRDVVLHARIDELERMSKDMINPPEWLTAELGELRKDVGLSPADISQAVEDAIEVVAALYESLEALFAEAA